MSRVAAPREIPPPLEVECLKALWALGEGNVHDVQQSLASTRKLAYTTVMTVLDRLARKGAVERRKAGRAFVYVPLLSRDVLRRLAVRQLVECYFDGSTSELLAYLEGREPEPAPERRVVLPEDQALDPALL